MNKNTKGIVTIIAVLAVAGGVWYFTTQNKRAYASIISKSGNAGNFAALLTFDEPFLRSWAKATKRNLETFIHNGKEYLTKGGKAK